MLLLLKENISDTAKLSHLIMMMLESWGVSLSLSLCLCHQVSPAF